MHKIQEAVLSRGKIIWPTVSNDINKLNNLSGRVKCQTGDEILTTVLRNR